MRPPLIVALTGVALAGALVAPAVAAPPPRAHAAAGASVTLQDISFKPSTVRIRSGQSVTWTWKDGTTPHNVTSVGLRNFKTSTSESTGTYTVRFAKPGTYRYVCTIHYGMNGKVVVR